VVSQTLFGLRLAAPLKRFSERPVTTADQVQINPPNALQNGFTKHRHYPPYRHFHGIKGKGDGVCFW
jgi:hypothetical protein